MAWFSIGILKPTAKSSMLRQLAPLGKLVHFANKVGIIQVPRYPYFNFAKCEWSILLNQSFVVFSKISQNLQFILSSLKDARGILCYFCHRILRTNRIPGTLLFRYRILCSGAVRYLWILWGPCVSHSVDDHCIANVVSIFISASGVFRMPGNSRRDYSLFQNRLTCCRYHLYV